MAYIDTYIASQDQNTLEAFVRNFFNHTPVVVGQDAISETTNDDGSVAPAQSAVGASGYYYACVRATFDVSPLVSDPISIISSELGKTICIFS